MISFFHRNEFLCYNIGRACGTCFRYSANTEFFRKQPYFQIIYQNKLILDSYDSVAYQSIFPEII